MLPQETHVGNGKVQNATVCEWKWFCWGDHIKKLLYQSLYTWDKDDEKLKWIQTTFYPLLVFPSGIICFMITASLPVFPQKLSETEDTLHLFPNFYEKTMDTILEIKYKKEPCSLRGWREIFHNFIRSGSGLSIVWHSQVTTAGAAVRWMKTLGEKAWDYSFIYYTAQKWKQKNI